jgi:hypothetical protein
MIHTTSSSPHHLHHAGCGCDTAFDVSRRRFLQFGGAVAALGLSGALSSSANAADAHYEAMLVNCIDPRVTTLSWAFMGEGDMRDKYSHFVIAGGPIGAISRKFADWHKVFWSNLEISVRLHSIKKVVALSHRDCSAAKLAFGQAAVATKAAETRSHSQALTQFRAAVAKRHPKLGVVTGIMALDGSVDLVG